MKFSILYFNNDAPSLLVIKRIMKRRFQIAESMQFRRPEFALLYGLFDFTDGSKTGQRPLA